MGWSTRLAFVCALAGCSAGQLDGSSYDAALDAGPRPIDVRGVDCASDDDCVAGWRCESPEGDEFDRRACACATAGAEQCNRRDDDCDGEVDEGACGQTPDAASVSHDDGGALGSLRRDIDPDDAGSPVADASEPDAEVADASEPDAEVVPDPRVCTPDPAIRQVSGIARTGSHWSIDATATDDGYALVYAGASDANKALFFGRFDRDGEPSVIDRAIAIRHHVDNPSLVFTGAGFTATAYDVWATTPGTNNSVVRIDATGGVLSDTTLPGVASDSVRLLFNGSTYATVQAGFQALDAAGNALGSRTDVTGGIWGANADAVWTGAHWLVANPADRDGGDIRYDLYVTRFDASGDRVGDEVRETASGRNAAPALATDGVNVAMAYGQDGQILLRMLSLDGTPITSDVSLGAGTASYGGFPRVIWNGAAYVVGYPCSDAGRTAVCLATIDAAGSVGRREAVYTCGDWLELDLATFDGQVALFVAESRGIFYRAITP